MVKLTVHFGAQNLNFFGAILQDSANHYLQQYNTEDEKLKDLLPNFFTLWMVLLWLHSFKRFLIVSKQLFVGEKVKVYQLFHVFCRVRFNMNIYGISHMSVILRILPLRFQVLFKAVVSYLPRLADVIIYTFQWLVSSKTTRR